MNIAMKVMLVIAGLLGSLWAFSQTTALVSAKDDTAVLIGLVGLVALIGVWVYVFVRFVVPWAKKHIDAQNAAKMLVLVTLAGLSVGGCSRIDPGHVGIEVDYYGKDRGVQDIPAVTGMVWYNPMTKTILSYPTFVQTAVWTRDKNEGSPINEEISFNSKEGTVFTADISLSYHLVSSGVPKFYVKFRTDDLKTFTHGYLHNIARDAFNELGQSYSMEEVYGIKKEELLTKVRELVNKQTSEFGVIVDQFGYIGAPRPPEVVVASINAKVKAIQDAVAAENQVRAIEAQARQAVARADGEARANKALAQSLSPELIQWRQLQLTEEAIRKWDGRRPMVEGATSGLLLSVTPDMVGKGHAQSAMITPPVK